MKNIYFVLSSTLLLTLTACKKEAPAPIEPVYPPDPPPVYVPIFEPGDTSMGAAYANKLTVPWAASVYCKKSFFDDSKIGITFFTYSTNSSVRESLGLEFMPLDYIGEYRFCTATTNINQLPIGQVFTSYATWVSDGDVLQDYYHMDSTDAKNRLMITKLDLANKRVEGTFHAAYNVQEPRVSPLNPKKVTFSAGRFWATIRD